MYAMSSLMFLLLKSGDGRGGIEVIRDVRRFVGCSGFLIVTVSRRLRLVVLLSSEQLVVIMSCLMFSRLLDVIGDGHSSVQEESSDEDASKRSRFRVAGEWKGESELLLSQVVEHAEAFVVLGLGGGMGVPSHMA
jgi:hypothetical protein